MNVLPRVSAQRDPRPHKHTQKKQGTVKDNVVGKHRRLAAYSHSSLSKPRDRGPQPSHRLDEAPANAITVTMSHNHLT